VISEFPNIQTYFCTFSNVASSEISAVKALFGEIPFRGTLPVTIPGVAQRGEGLHSAGSQGLLQRERGNHHVSQSLH
jgi:beta-N-acetylhexosaminidase